jgi:hypothetical protein
MDGLVERLTTGLNGKVLLAVVVLLVFVYLPYLLITLRRRKNRQQLFEAHNREAVKLYLALDLVGTLTVCSVDGREPEPFYETTRRGYFLHPGENTLEVEYHWSIPSPLSLTGYKNYNVGPQRMVVHADTGKIYEIGYDIKRKKFEIDGKQ